MAEQDSQTRLRKLTEKKEYWGFLQGADLIEYLRLRKQAEPDAPSLYLVFGRGYKKVESSVLHEPVTPESCRECGFEKAETDGLCSVNCREGWRRRWTKPDLWGKFIRKENSAPVRSTSSAESSLSRTSETEVSGQNAKKISIENKVLISEQHREICPKTPETVVFDRYHVELKNGDSSASESPIVKKGGRPRKWASDAERKAIQRARLKESTTAAAPLPERDCETL